MTFLTTYFQHSHWSTSSITTLSLVESFRVLKYFHALKGPIIGALGDATPAVLCHKEPAPSPSRGLWIPYWKIPPLLRRPVGACFPVHPWHTLKMGWPLTNISPLDFVHAFVTVWRTCLLPNIQWTSFQILTRTLWTNMKEANSAFGWENGANGRCANCLDDLEHTLHLMFDCPVASQVLDRSSTMFLLRPLFPPPPLTKGKNFSLHFWTNWIILELKLKVR